MRKSKKILYVTFLLLILSSYLVPIASATIQNSNMEAISTDTSSIEVQSNIEFDDVITSSDAGAGDMTTKDILLVFLIVLAVIGIIFIAILV